MARYLIVGNHTVDGVAPGGTIDVDDERRARRLVRAGHLTPAEDVHVCTVCGRDDFKTAGGLASHQRSHEES